MQATAEMMGTVFERMVNDANRVQQGDPGDYYGQDGLLMCGQCFTPKQCIVPVTIGGEVCEMRPGCLCKCGLASREREEEERRKAIELSELDRLRGASLMTNRLQQYTFDMFQCRPENERVYKLLRHYVDSFSVMLEKNQGLLLHGPVGGGKTFAAMCIANALLVERRSVLVTSMVQLLSADPYGDDNAFGARAGKVALMVLDDLGAERNTDFALERVYSVIDGRTRAGKPLIVTTNLTPGQMLQTEYVRYRRIFSRVLETCYPVAVEGISWRMESAANRFDEMRKCLED